MCQDSGHWKIVYDAFLVVGGRTNPRRANGEKIVGLTDKFGINIDSCDGSSLKVEGWKWISVGEGNSRL
jgi:hypothetical protein